MANVTEIRKLSNGMTILGEHMNHLGSVSFCFLLPCGTSRLPLGACGSGNVILDWLFRGAGDMDSRHLVEAFDMLGIHRGNGVGNYKLRLAAALEASNLNDALDLYSKVILKPTLDSKQFELSRQLALSELAGLDDNPRQKVMSKLISQFYSPPFGRPADGTEEDLESLTHEGVKGIIDTNFNISNTFFSIAGKFDMDKVCEKMENLFGSVQSEQISKLPSAAINGESLHIQHEGSQVHIGIITETPHANTEDYYNAMLAVSILSGGMSSRLFTEVREKRGLCYSVGARYNSIRDKAGILCYAGTTPQQAQETLDVTIAEFNKLADGISDDELLCAKAGLKSSLVMQSDSSNSRAESIGNDLNILGRVRSIEEISNAIDNTTVDTVIDYLKRNPFEKYTVVTIGSTEVKLPN